MRIHDPKGGRVRILDCFLDRVCFLLTPLHVEDPWAPVEDPWAPIQ
jgi:hypothetical protein